jgi:DNA-binding MarR family transcriptional regulator
MTAADLPARLASEGIGATAYGLMLNIEVTPECVGDLARMMKTSHVNCSQHVSRLEGRGLVQRIKGVDKEYRKVSVCITQAGLEMLRRIEG